MQGIGGTLEHLAAEATSDKDIFARLMEVVEALTRNNASVTAQFRDAMRIHVDIANNININTTQDPKERKLV